MKKFEASDEWYKKMAKKEGDINISTGKELKKSEIMVCKFINGLDDSITLEDIEKQVKREKLEANPNYRRRLRIAFYLITSLCIFTSYLTITNNDPRAYIIVPISIAYLYYLGIGIGIRQWIIKCKEKLKKNK